MIYQFGEEVKSLPNRTKRLFQDHIFEDKFIIYEKEIDKQDADFFFQKYGKTIPSQYYAKHNDGKIEFVTVGLSY
jgi:hypothetical protein